MTTRREAAWTGHCYELGPWFSFDGIRWQAFAAARPSGLRGRFRFRGGPLDGKWAADAPTGNRVRKGPARKA